MSDRTIFVACPIGDNESEERGRSDKVLKHIIEPVAEGLGCRVVRADKLAQPGQITMQIAEHLNSADVVIADLTGPNANVMYELGVRHAIGKPFILMAEEGQALPFDVMNFRTIFCKLDLDRVLETKEQLGSQLEAALSGEFPGRGQGLYDCPPDSPTSLRSQPEVLEEILRNIRVLRSNELTTEFLGTFPQYFEEHVVRCVADARNRVLIACDFPAIAVFSAGEAYESYIQTLEELRRQNVPVKVLVLNQRRRDELNRLLIPQDWESWEKLKADDGNPFHKNLDDFNRRHGTQIDTPESLYEKFQQLDAVAIEKFRGGIVESVDEIDSLMPVQFWIADDKRAIFSIPALPEPNSTLGRIDASYAFETRHHNLIVSLERIWQSYYKTSLTPPAETI
jgi:hypothetical protein